MCVLRGYEGVKLSSGCVGQMENAEGGREQERERERERWELEGLLISRGLLHGMHVQFVCGLCIILASFGLRGLILLLTVEMRLRDCFFNIHNRDQAKKG